MVKFDIMETLEELDEVELRKFQWYLQQEDVLEDHPRIPRSHLQNATREDTVDKMVQFHPDSALPLALEILRKIKRHDLVKRLTKKYPTGPGSDSRHQPPSYKPSAPEDKLREIQIKYKVDVTLDPDTADPKLILSEDGKQVRHGDKSRDVTDNPRRFESYASILAKEGFSSGKFYYEVQVKGKNAWGLGVTKESSSRKGRIISTTSQGFWTLGLYDGIGYKTNAGPDLVLSLNQAPQKVGVFVDYEEGEVSFFDVDQRSRMCSFTGQEFTEKLYPYFSPHYNDGGKNASPLVITPVWI